MPYVQRNADGVVVGLSAKPIPGVDPEFIEDVVLPPSQEQIMDEDLSSLEYEVVVGVFMNVCPSEREDIQLAVDTLQGSDTIPWIMKDGGERDMTKQEMVIALNTLKNGVLQAWGNNPRGKPNGSP